MSDHRAPIEIKDPVSERIDRTIESRIREVVPAEVISAREAVDKARLAEIIGSSLLVPSLPPSKVGQALPKPASKPPPPKPP